MKSALLILLVVIILLGVPLIAGLALSGQADFTRLFGG